jgi:hypothetical protein
MPDVMAASTDKNGSEPLPESTTSSRAHSDTDSPAGSTTDPAQVATRSFNKETANEHAGAGIASEPPVETIRTDTPGTDVRDAVTRDAGTVSGIDPGEHTARADNPLRVNSPVRGEMTAASQDQVRTQPLTDSTLPSPTDSDINTDADLQAITEEEPPRHRKRRVRRWPEETQLPMPPPTTSDGENPQEAPE